MSFQKTKMPNTDMKSAVKRIAPLEFVELGVREARNEQLRLALLAELGILDTAPEPGFDALTHAAATLTGCPIAMVSLVDGDRQWFKSRVGLDQTQTPRQCRSAHGRFSNPA